MKSPKIVVFIVILVVALLFKKYLVPTPFELKKRKVIEFSREIEFSNQLPQLRAALKVKMLPEFFVPDAVLRYGGQEYKIMDHKQYVVLYFTKLSKVKIYHQSFKQYQDGLQFVGMVKGLKSSGDELDVAFSFRVFFDEKYMIRTVEVFDDELKE